MMQDSSSKSDEEKQPPKKGTKVEETDEVKIISFSSSIYTVLRQVHPVTGISNKAMAVMNSIVNNILDDVIHESRILIEKTGIHTLSSREIQTAVRLYFPGELAKHAVSEGTKAVTKYNANEHEGAKTKEEMSGITFEIGLVHKILKNKLRYNVSATASVYMTAALEYICAEVLELSGNCARDLKVPRITPRHIGLSIRGDEDLDKLFPGIVASAGVIPHIHRSLISRFSGIELDEVDGN